MIQLLVVDDEPVILEHLSRIPWASVGVDAVHTAESAIAALEILRKQPVDLVITDIRMPGMSGLELCEQIRNLRSRTKYILLSGHAEFEYAKKAVKSGAIDYLLKPIENEEILRMVAETVRQIRREDAEKSAWHHSMYTLRSQLPALKSAMLNRLLTDRRLSSDAIRDRLSELSLPFAMGEPTAVVMLRLEGLFADADERNVTLYEYAVNNMAEEILGESFHIGTCTDEYNYLVVLAMPKSSDRTSGEGTSRLYAAASALQASVNSYLKGTVSVVLSPFGRFPDDLPDLYRRSLNMLQKLPGRHTGSLIRLWDPPSTETFQSLQAICELPSLAQLYERGGTAEAGEKLERIFREIREKRLDSNEHRMEVFFYLSNAFSYIIHQWGKHWADVLERGSGMGVDPRDFRSVKQLEEWAYTIHRNILESVFYQKSTSQGNLVRRVQLYIEQHIAEASLQTVADHLSLHPAYVSAMYKQESGENLSDYMLRCRMEKSGYLLRNTRFKIYEIAAQLGYQHTPYFSKLFKNHYGITPQEYREQLH